MSGEYQPNEVEESGGALEQGRPHYRLDAWTEAMKLVRLVYLVTSKFPQAEQYGLTAQLRRSAISIPSNIAEGAARSGAREFAYFLNVARGSISELETQLLIAQELDFIEAEVDLFHCLDRVSKLVTGLHRSVSG